MLSRLLLTRIASTASDLGDIAWRLEAFAVRRAEIVRQNRRKKDATIAILKILFLAFSLTQHLPNLSSDE